MLALTAKSLPLQYDYFAKSRQVVDISPNETLKFASFCGR
jgi:hypothetical protein